MEKDKVIISIQLPREIHTTLKELAKENCTSVSYLIRKAILKVVKEELKDE